MKKIYFVLLLFCISALISHAQNLSIIWKSIYTDSSAASFHVNDAVVDSAGNSYLTGYKMFPGENYFVKHLFLMKVNARGTQEWIHYFNNKFDSIDAPTAIALDAAGYIYVTGTRIDTLYSSKISDIITMKYNAAGEQLWLNRYHDAIYKLASPTDITVSAEGTAIVTGDDDTKAFIEKINTDGKTIWKRKIKDIVANTAGFDNESNIIVGGSSNPLHVYQTQKPMVMKLSAAGDSLRSAVLDDYERYGQIYFVACDSLNAVYASGQTDTNAFYNNPKILTIKYNRNGERKWFRKEENQSNVLQHYDGDFKLDVYGNSYITGYIHRSNINDDWLVTKYNSRGERQWKNYYDDSIHGFDRSVGLAVNKNGITYVTGYSLVTANSNANIVTIAYNINGSQLAINISSPNKRSGSLASGIGLDKEGNVYLEGEFGSNHNPYPSSIVIKYKLKQIQNISKISSLKITDDLKIFPNPVNNTMNIIFTTSAPAKNYNLVISDINGNAVLSKQLSSTEKMVMY